MQQRFAQAGIPVLVLFLVLAALILPAPAMAQDACRSGEVRLDRNTGAIRDLGGCLRYLEDPDQS
ncbi:MAG TPA: hypothetical protein DD385_06925, partial [Marinobacter sp.]|nr:hypothetical protein [Marinobacter sp.]